MGNDSQSNIVAVIACRSKSSRFPDKFKADICGKPMLLRIVESVRESNVDKVIVAGVNGDFPVIEFCQEHKIGFVTGEERDILGRVYQAAQGNNATIVVRIWGDSPLIKPHHINYALKYFSLNSSPYLCVYTSGGAIAIMGMEELERLQETLTDPQDREWLHKYQSGLQGAIKLDFGSPITVDTPGDLEGVRELVNQRNKRPVRMG